MIFATKNIGSKSSKNFVLQQNKIGKQEGYIEEMMNGLKVIKSFCHEEDSEKAFDVINGDLQKVSTDANSYANTLMPAIGNIGNLTYVVVALVGTILFLYGVPNLNIYSYGAALQIGVVVSFLPMVKQFTNNGSEVANQINYVALATGGSENCRYIESREGSR